MKHHAGFMVALIAISCGVAFVGIVILQNMPDTYIPNPELSPSGGTLPHRDGVDVLANGQSLKDHETPLGCLNAGGTILPDAETGEFVECQMPHEVVQGVQGITGYP